MHSIIFTDIASETEVIFQLIQNMILWYEMHNCLTWVIQPLQNLNRYQGNVINTQIVYIFEQTAISWNRNHTAN